MDRDCRCDLPVFLCPEPHRGRALMLRFLCSVSLVAITAAVLAPPIQALPPRTVAIGDVHGDYQGFVSILRHAGLVDEKLEWSGGEATLVQTGDLLDRGPGVRSVLDLLMNLEQGAGRSGGRVEVLLGNHEVMNLTSVFRDVNPLAYSAFAGPASETVRADGYREYVALHEALARRYADVSALPVLSEREWMDAHPPGSLEYQAALDRDGLYGRWLRGRPSIAKVGQTVFVHGGVSPDPSGPSLEQLNARVRSEIEGFDRIREYLIAQKLILPFSSRSEIAPG